MESQDSQLKTRNHATRLSCDHEGIAEVDHVDIQEYLAAMNQPRVNADVDDVKIGRIVNTNDVIDSVNRLRSSVTYNYCAGCGEKIVDRFLLHAVDRYWHTNCLRCSSCLCLLSDLGTSCFSRSGLILCKNDYIKMFVRGGNCYVCRQSVPANEFVMKLQGNVYHLKCFACMSCHNQLIPGDRFGLVNGRLICEQDYPKVLKTHIQMQQRHLSKTSSIEDVPPTSWSHS